MQRNSFFVFTVWAVLVVWAPRAEAAPGAATQAACMSDEVCRVHYETGRQMSKDDRFAEAIAAYDLAYKRLPVPLLLFNIGRLHQRAGHDELAAYYYLRYLRESAESERAQQERAQQRLAEVKAALAEKGTPLPDPTGPPPTASAAPAPPSTPAAAPVLEKKPIHKRWWFGTLIGVGGALAIAVATGVAVTQSRPGETPMNLMRFEANF